MRIAIIVEDDNILRWRHINNKDNWRRKCTECWLAYERGIQSGHSLKCWKLGIPYSAFRDINRALMVIEEIVRDHKEWSMKHTVEPGIMRILSRGVIIIYTPSRKDMVEFIKICSRRLRDQLKKPGLLDEILYRILVNTDRVGDHFYYRRGCPEYDRKFGDWRRWPRT